MAFSFCFYPVSSSENRELLNTDDDKHRCVFLPGVLATPGLFFWPLALARLLATVQGKQKQPCDSQFDGELLIWVL